MIVLSNSVAQVLAPGQSMTFDTVIMHTGCGECYRPNSGSVGLRSKSGVYEINAAANIGATVADAAQIAIQYDSSPLLETTMISQTAAAGDLNNVSCTTAVRTCCCDGGTVTVTNTGTTSVNIGAHPLLYIRRTA